MLSCQNTIVAKFIELRRMFKSLIATILIILSVSLFGCSIGVSGLQSHVDVSDGYEFLYPNGWVGVDVKTAPEGIDVAYQDLIDPNEKLSVIISDINQDKNLEDLGTPLEVGERFMQKVNNNANSNLEAELINAELRENNDKNYYILEYLVKLPNNQAKHNVASVVIRNGKLFTFNISTSEYHWNSVKKQFITAAKSFSVT